METVGQRRKHGAGEGVHSWLLRDNTNDYRIREGNFNCLRAVTELIDRNLLWGLNRWSNWPQRQHEGSLRCFPSEYNVKALSEWPLEPGQSTFAGIEAPQFNEQRERERLCFAFVQMKSTLQDSEYQMQRRKSPQHWRAEHLGIRVSSLIKIQTKLLKTFCTKVSALLIANINSSHPRVLRH